MTTRRIARLSVNGAPRVVDLFRTIPSFPHLSASDYGAVGDNVFDNQSALSSAISDAKKTQKPLFLPPGRYRHSEQFALDGVILFGTAAATTSLIGSTSDNHAIILTGTNPGVHNVGVQGPGKTPRSSSRASNGIYVVSATGYAIRGCHIHSVAGAGVMVENSDHGLERGNFIEATGADGMYHTEGSHHIEIAYNRTLTTGDDGISITSYDDVSGFVHDFEIHHNSVLGNWESRAITVNGTSGAIVVHDNHVDGGTAGVALSSVSAWGSLHTVGVSVYNNTIRNINQSRHDAGAIGGGAISFWNDVVDTDRDLVVHHNRIWNPGLHGIYAGGNNVILADVNDNDFYLDQALALDLIENANAEITQLGNTTSPLNSYPGDLIPSTVGGIDAAYRFQLEVV